jgi:hypothetical protein
MKRYRSGWEWEDIYKRCSNWSEVVEKWNGKIAVHTRFEDLLADTLSELRRVVDAMQVQYDPQRLPGVVKRQRWGNRIKELKKEGGKTHPWYRKILSTGKSGNWRMYLPREWRKPCHDIFWPLMHELGYEDDQEWWKNEPAAHRQS